MGIPSGPPLLTDNHQKQSKTVVIGSFHSWLEIELDFWHRKLQETFLVIFGI